MSNSSAPFGMSEIQGLESVQFSFQVGGGGAGGCSKIPQATAILPALQTRGCYSPVSSRIFLTAPGSSAYDNAASALRDIF